MKRLLLASAILLVGCEATPGGGSLLTSLPIPLDCTSSASSLTTNAYCAGKDLMAASFAKPAPLREFDYSETDEFDLQLSSSMSAGLGEITVNVTGDDMTLDGIAAQTVPAADSERIVFWMSKIRKTGGENKACEMIRLESAIANWALGFAAGQLESYLIYKPAAGYNSLIYYDNTDEAQPIRKMVFKTRSEEPLTCN